MRTTIEIDDDLIAAALQATGLQTKQEVVELGLRTLVHLQEQLAIKLGKEIWRRCAMMLLSQTRDPNPAIGSLC